MGRSTSWDSCVPYAAHHTHKADGGGELHWSVTDSTSSMEAKVRLPLASFNHIAREVLSLERSKSFYVDVLGFDVGPRPPFDSDGYWLYGYGLSLHLVLTTQPAARKLLKKDRIKYFTTCLPKVDHVAFITSDISIIRRTLDERNVYYKYDCPANTGIEQVFFFDPDGNVIEVSNCAVREQACGAEAIAVAAAATAAALSPLRPPQLEGIPLRAQRTPISTIVRSPSQVYINGANVIVSPVHIDPASLPFADAPEDGTTARVPTDMQIAIDKALLAAAGLPSLLQFATEQETDTGDEGIYIFDESFDFEEAESRGAAVTVTGSEGGGEEDGEDDDPDNLLLLESLGLEIGR